MKKKLYLLIFLFILTNNIVTAQIKVEDSEKAKTYIKEARKYASEQEYGDVAEYLQKAYDINPALFDCKLIQLLGISYYMMEEAPFAVKFLEEAINCENEKQSLVKLYSYLGLSYNELGEYKKAVICYEKAILNSKDNKEISDLYEDLATIHFDNGGCEKAVESMRKRISYYLKHLAITESDIMKGVIKDNVLGEMYFALGGYASEIKLNYETIDSIIKSALCGNEEAITFCKEHSINYQNRIEAPNVSSQASGKAKELIEEAIQLATKHQYKLVALNLEKAHSLNPTLFDGKIYHLLGLSYFSQKKYDVAISYLEQATHYDMDKKGLYYIYTTLADAYDEQGAYRSAEVNAEKALFLAFNDKEVLKCSLKLASIYFSQKNYDGTIESYQNAIKYYMKINHISYKEVMKGAVQDEFLAEIYVKLSFLLKDVHQGEESDNQLIKAALCGSSYAIDILEKSGVNYKSN